MFYLLTYLLTYTCSAQYHMLGWGIRYEMSDRINVLGCIRKKGSELRELLGSEPASLVIKKGRLRWFGHAACKDDDCRELTATSGTSLST